MQPQRVVAPGDFYEPDPFARTSQAKPPSNEPAPSMWEGITSTFRSAASIDEAPIRLREATDSALADLVSDLEQRGIDKRRLQRREARAGFALVYDEDAIWQAVTAARRQDAKAFAGLPATLDEFRDRATAAVRKSMGDDAATAARSGWVPWLTGTLGSGLSDPLNVATLPLGVGASRSFADAVLKGAMLNTGIEAMQLPSRAVERAAQGRDLTTQEGLITLGIAGLAGGALGGAGKLLERGIGPRSPIATEARDTIGVDRMTDAERGAADALDRTAEIDATNPFGPGAGAAAHEARMDAEIRAALDRVAARDRPAPSPAPAASRSPARAAAPPAATLSGDARATFKRNVRRAESGGNDAARASTSSATGRYQFTRSTWLNYHRQVVGGEMSDDARWAQATDGNLQERLMDALTADNARALARIGARETPGNLYLMHFAGQAGARKILQAAPDTPIEQILTAEAIAANRFLRGKTAGDVIEWTHAKVGGDPDVPVLPRDRYADDEQWASAQREVDAAEAELRAVDDELAAIARGDDADTVAPIERYTAIERDAEPVGMNWEPAIVERPSFERVIDPYSPPKALPRRVNPSDVIEFLADRGGIRNDGGHDLLNTHGLARLTVPPVVRKTGMDLDRAGELLWEAGYFVTRPTEAEVLDLVDVAARGRASGRRKYAMGDQDEMDRRLDALDRNERMDHDVRQELDRQFGDAFSPDEDADLFADILSMTAGGKNPGDALIELLDARQATTLGRAAAHAEDNGFDDVFPDGWIPGIDERPGGWPTFTDESLGSRAAAEGGDGSAVSGGAAGGGGGDRPNAGSIGGSTPEAVAARVAPFDDPFGPGAARQADSLEHDLRMAIDPAIAARQRQEADLRAASPMRATTDQDSEIGMPLFDAADQGSFRLAEDGDARAVPDLLDELDGDEAAIVAARACMAP